MIRRLLVTFLFTLIFLSVFYLLSQHLSSFEPFQDKPVEGRYIHLQHQQKGCLNLAEIRVVSYPGGPNRVTPQTLITKSSVFTGDAGPNSSFHDRNLDTIIHTSCEDIPWIRIDFGQVIPIHSIHIINRQDCCQQRAVGLILSILDIKQKSVYVSNPVKDKKGRTTYVETNTENENRIDYPYTMTWYPPKEEPVYDQTEEDLSAQLTCRNLHTPWNEEGNGNAVYLDRHNVQCEGDEVIKGFQLIREGNEKGLTGRYRYNYRCCKMNIPSFPPAPPAPAPPAPTFSSLLPQEWKDTLPRLSQLESEVQHMKQTQSASPQRIDIQPNTQLSPVAHNAAGVSIPASFLENAQKVIRNELLALRSTTPVMRT